VFSHKFLYCKTWRDRYLLCAFQRETWLLARTASVLDDQTGVFVFADLGLPQKDKVDEEMRTLRSSASTPSIRRSSLSQSELPFIKTSPGGSDKKEYGYSYSTNWSTAQLFPAPRASWFRPDHVVWVRFVNSFCRFARSYLVGAGQRVRSPFRVPYTRGFSLEGAETCWMVLELPLV
jgi:hypothetical protein